MRLPASRPAASRLPFAFLFTLLATGAVAGSYQDLRAGNPALDASVASMPASGLHGTLSRLSSLLAQPRVADLPAGSSTELTASWERQVESTLTHLSRDLASLEYVDFRDRLIIAQAVEAVGFRHLAPLYSDLLHVNCAHVEDCPNRPVVQALDGIATQLAATLRDAMRAGAPPDEGPGYEPDLHTMAAWLDEVLASERATGVEHIDY